MRASIGAAIAILVLSSAVLAEHPKAKPKPAASTSAEPLDGKVFSGEFGKVGASTGDPDTLTFKKGSFVSSACVPFGFESTPYTVSKENGATTFTAKATSKSGETMEWTGTLRGEALEATAVRRTSSGETETYWFKGKAGKAKAAEPPKSEHPEHPK
jgi:hypothetical protein